MDSTSVSHHDQNIPAADADADTDTNADDGRMADQSSSSSFSSNSNDAYSHEDNARYFIRPTSSAERSSLGLNLSADDLGGNAEDGNASSNESARSNDLAASHTAQHEQYQRVEDSTASPEDAPATAAANEVATLPVTSLSVEAIDVLIANADQPQSARSSQQQPTPIPPPRPQPQPQPAPSNAAAIVRSIASYLSLSDAESIGSLACTPYGTTIGLGTGSTPRSVYSHSSSVASRRSRLSSGMSTSSRRRLRSRSHGSRSSSGVAAAESGEVRPPSSVQVAHHHDDADAAAGGGSGGRVGGGSISQGSAGRTPVAGILHRSRAGSSVGGGGGSVSWAGGDGLSLTPAPGRVSLDDEEEEDYIEGDEGEDLSDHEEEDEELDIRSPPFDEESMRVFRRQQRKVIQQKLTAAVMSHPHSIRSYCLEAQRAASEMKSQRIKKKEEEEDNKGDIPDDRATNLARKQRLEKRQRVRILRSILKGVLSNVPLSVLFDLAEATFETSLDTTVAAFKVTATSIDGAVSVLASVVSWSFETVTSLNPFVIVGTILAIQRDAAYHATDALVSGIQSVATGVGSAGTISMNALNVLSRAGGGHASAGAAGAGIAGKRNASTVGIAEQANFGSASRFLSRMNLLRHGTTVEKNNKLSDKLYRKLSKVDSSSRVLSYIEREDDAISQHGRKRVQRMMHYHISLRPFVATVSAPKGKGARRNSPPASFDGMRVLDDLPTAPPSRQNSGDMQQMQMANSVTASAGDEEDDDSEPFMCTPKSFPPTPTSRSNVMARGFRFSEDVVFLARDQLRVHGGLDSDNPQTRAMARALKEGSRLAVFDINDPTSSVALSCGQHVAQKVGNNYYCSTRSMIPILRNCYVYFEMSVAPPLHNSSMFQLASLSVGISTLEMPLNALVGQWKGSIGLCTTGQILVAGQWSSPLDPLVSAYGNNSTIGCLVYLDDESAFETWDGTMVTANVTFSVNGRVVETQAANMPFGTAHQGGGPPGRQQQMDNIEERDQGEEQSGNQQDGRGSLIMPLYVPREEEVYATLTLHSPETQVMARFSADDILARSRANIGVPDGVTVYAVDGSVVLTEEMNEVEVAATTLTTGVIVNGSDDNDDESVPPPPPSLIEDE